MMNRRDVLKIATAVTGMGLISPISAALLTEHEATLIKGISGNVKPQHFDQVELDLLSLVMNTILPRTDSPSASDVNTHLIMDNMFAQIFKPSYKKNFQQRFSALQQLLMKQNFVLANPSHKLALLQQLESTKPDQRTASHQAYFDIKQQTISYYLKTEEISKKHLNYLPIPGIYVPCIKVSEVNNIAWAI